MAEKPTPLLLMVLGGMATALLSPLNVQGEIIFSLVIPFALITTAWYDLESGLVVGAGISLLSGALIHSLNLWETLAYLLASSAAVIGYSSLSKEKKTTHSIYLLLFAALGTLLLELLNDLSTGESLLLRSEHFLGTNPAGGIKLLFNILFTWGLIQYYPLETKKEKN